MNWTENIRKVVPYVPGEQPKQTNVIKLNTNENPYAPSPLVKKVLTELDTDVLRKYPDTMATELLEELAKYHNLPKENIFIGVGSDDVIAMAFMTYFNGKEPILFPDITYSFYDVWAELLRIPYQVKALDDDFRIVCSDYDNACGGIIIPNPNAPTGVAESVEFFENIIKKHLECVVMIDEAYVDFGAQSCVELIDKYDNLLVIRTFSKSRSMAGNRIGYAIGNKELIKYLYDVKFSFNSYTMDTITVKLGAASVRDDAYFKENIVRVIETREWTKKQLSQLDFEFPDSKSNFIFAKHKSKSATMIFEELKKKNIYVRHFSKPERIADYLRISIGTKEEMQTLINELRDILK